MCSDPVVVLGVVVAGKWSTETSLLQLWAGADNPDLQTSETAQSPRIAAVDSCLLDIDRALEQKGYCRRKPARSSDALDSRLQSRDGVAQNTGKLEKAKVSLDLFLSCCCMSSPEWV